MIATKIALKHKSGPGNARAGIAHRIGESWSISTT
jgi:hypothetical protein